MPNTDTSASARTRAMRNITLATFHRSNPNTNEAGTNKTFSGAFLIDRMAGQLSDCCQQQTNIICTPGTITGFSAGADEYGFTFPTGGSGIISDPYYYDVSWNPLSGAISYTVTSVLSDLTTPLPPDTITSTGPTSARITTADSEWLVRVFQITAQTNCGTTSASIDINPCFLAGSLVQMADETTNAIEDICVGDLVLGAFGEINTVLALHRPLLGNALMCKINGEHNTTNHHPHISVDRQFYCGDPDLVSNTTYGKIHKVIDAEGNLVNRMLYGLNKNRIQKLQVGIELKTVEGSRKTRTLETYSMPKDTQLYNLVIGGSHTYHVDGYAVTGWPREDDFDYDNWVQI